MLWRIVSGCQKSLDGERGGVQNSATSSRAARLPQLSQLENSCTSHQYYAECCIGGHIAKFLRCVVLRQCELRNRNFLQAKVSLLRTYTRNISSHCRAEIIPKEHSENNIHSYKPLQTQEGSRSTLERLVSAAFNHYHQPGDHLSFEKPGTIAN